MHVYSTLILGLIAASASASCKSDVKKMKRMIKKRKGVIAKQKGKITKLKDKIDKLMGLFCAVSIFISRNTMMHV